MKKPIRPRSAQQSYAERLYLANEGTSIAGALSTQAYPGTQTDSRLALLSMLTLKVADHLRLAMTALSSGYYYSVPILLRSALDSIGVLCLTSQDYKELKKWAFLTYVSGRELGVDPIQLREMRSDLYSKARSSYDSLLSKDPHVHPVKELIWEFNIHVHPGLEGLLEIIGIPLELDELLGVEAGKVLKIAEGDLNKAVELLGLAGRRSQSKPRQGPIAKTEAGVSELGYLNEDLLDYYSSVLHAATHHLLELADYTFGSSASPELVKALKEWQARSSHAFKAHKRQQRQQ